MLDRTLDTTRARPTPSLYRVCLVGFLACLALTLLTIVDIRRGFLFSEYVRSPFAVFHVAHLAMLAVGASGMALCYALLRSLEARLPIGSTVTTVFAWVVVGLLVIDLFVYRGVPAARALASSRLSADWLQAFGATGWWRPVALAVSYLLTVWHATLLGILLAGLALTILPRYLQHLYARRGFIGTLIGALYAVPQPFCSCCAAVMAPAYARRGSSTEFALSFVVGAPMLNITTLILAFSLLPLPFALTRAVAGIVLTLVVTYGVVRLAEGWERRSRPRLELPRAPRGLTAWITRWVNAYLRMFNLDTLVRDRAMDTPAALVSAWVYASARIALVLVPTLFLWSIVTAALLQLVPTAFGNNLPSVVLAAITGTLLMISTWTEIPVALQLIQSGLSAPAATLLVVLPPVSLPCLMVLGGALGRARIVALLGLAVIGVGIVAGLLFL